MSNTTVNALDTALRIARAEGRTVRSIKDLLCDACGDAAALAPGGYCHACAAELAAHYDTTREAHSMAAADEAGSVDLSRWCVGDDEGELVARGIRC